MTSLRIAAFDGQAVTVGVRTSTAARVLLTAWFASGRSPGDLAARPAQTVALRGATSYRIGLRQPFSSPDCGTTVYRRVRVSTIPAARGGARTRTVKVTGPPCPVPVVESVAVDGWDGRTAAVSVRTSGRGPVEVSSVFTRDGHEAGADTRTLSGRTSYSFTVPATGLGVVECGKRAVFGVRVTTEPAAPGGPREAEILVAGPRCPKPQESPSKPRESPREPAEESPSPEKDPGPARSPEQGRRSPEPPESSGPGPRDSTASSPQPRSPGQRSPEPQDSPPPR